MDTIGVVITVAVRGHTGWHLKAAVDGIRERREARGRAVTPPPASPAHLVGICGNPSPMVSPRSEPLHCTLPAKHEGWHHDLHAGADWSAA